MRCKHDWEVVIDKVLPSGFEQMKDSLAPGNLKVSSNMFCKTSITILKCKLCGKLDKTVERS